MRKLGATKGRSQVGMMAYVVVACALGLIVSTLPGCSTLGGGDKKKTADPILGEVHPQSAAPYGPTPPTEKDKARNSTDNKSSAITPADPLLTPSPTSNVYLASITPPLPGSKTLAIADRQSPGSFQLTANSETAIRPVPKDPAFVNNSWVSPTTNANSPGKFASQSGQFVDPQIAVLQTRGITQHRIDPLPDGRIRLLAFAPQPDNPSQIRTYDVTARDVPEAVQAVLRQLDQRR